MSILINAYCTLREVPVLDFPHQLHGRRDHSDPELLEHLNGFIGYVLEKCGDGEQMTQVNYYLMRHIQRTVHHISLTVEDKDLDAFAKWGWSANAICFIPDGTVTDPSGSVLAAPGTGQPDDQALLPFPPDAIDRKKETDEFLKKKAFQIPAALPPVVGEAELELRPAAEVAKRALALFAVAVRGESLAGKDELPVDELKEKMPLAFDAMSKKEKKYMAKPEPKEQETINFVWRYEALYLLQWALRMVDELPYPANVCDVPALAERITGMDEKKLIANASLRPANEILDALDLYYRLNWVVQHSSTAGPERLKNLEPGVVHERHYALNWLTYFENADWDDVDTPA